MALLLLRITQVDEVRLIQGCVWVGLGESAGLGVTGAAAGMLYGVVRGACCCLQAALTNAVPNGYSPPCPCIQPVPCCMASICACKVQGEGPCHRGRHRCPCKTLLAGVACRPVGLRACVRADSLTSATIFEYSTSPSTPAGLLVSSWTLLLSTDLEDSVRVEGSCAVGNTYIQDNLISTCSNSPHPPWRKPPDLLTDIVTFLLSS